MPFSDNMFFMQCYVPNSPRPRLSKVHFPGITEVLANSDEKNDRNDDDRKDDDGDGYGYDGYDGDDDDDDNDGAKPDVGAVVDFMLLQRCILRMFGERGALGPGVRVEGEGG